MSSTTLPPSDTLVSKGFLAAYLHSHAATASNSLLKLSSTFTKPLKPENITAANTGPF